MSTWIAKKSTLSKSQRSNLVKVNRQQRGQRMTLVGRLVMTLVEEKMMSADDVALT